MGNVVVCTIFAEHRLNIVIICYRGAVRQGGFICCDTRRVPAQAGGCTHRKGRGGAGCEEEAEYAQRAGKVVRMYGRDLGKAKE